MGVCSSKQKVTAPKTLLQQPGSPGKPAAGENATNGVPVNVVHRFVRMPIRTGTLNEILAVVSRRDTLLALKNIAGLSDIEIIVVSDGMICAHTRYANKASMEEAEPKVRELLKPVTKYFAGAPERSLAIGGAVVVAGQQVWMLSECVVHHRFVRMPIRPGTLDQILTAVSRPDTLAALKNIAGVLDMEIFVVSDGLICSHTRYASKASMEEAGPKVRKLLKPVAEYFTGPPERSLAIGGTVALAGEPVWTLSKCTVLDALAAMAALPAQEAAEAFVAAAAVTLVPVFEEMVGGDAEGSDPKGSSYLCCS